jgi:hypothetical protein
MIQILKISIFAALMIGFITATTIREKHKKKPVKTELKK